MNIQYVSQSTGLYTSNHLGRLLGEGAFGSTFELYDDTNNPTGFACKIIETQEIKRIAMSKRDSLRDTINEIHSLQTMGLLEGYTRKDDTFFIVMKKVNGQNPYIHFDNVTLLSNSFNALRDCHRKNITHFDAHPGNFLTDPQTGKTTAIDFGQSSDASFINTFFDSFNFLLKNKLLDKYSEAFLFIPLLYSVDYIKYLKKNKLETLINLTWWFGLIYGAVHGIPALMLPNHFFYDYLKSKLLFQAFLELRSLGLMRVDLAKFFLSNALSYKLQAWIHNNQLNYIYKHIMKPIYFASLYVPYKIFNNFYQANIKLVEKLWSTLTKNKIADNAAAIIETVKTAQASMGYDTNKQLLDNFYQLLTKENITNMLTAPTTHLCFQTALLYHPIKAGLTFINDAIINPLQPECVAKARADLYFQHHPMLYAKAAVNTVYNTAAACVNDVNNQKPAFS